MEFSFQNSNQSQNPQSDRLRKAIERNRAKQARRDAKQSTVRTPPPRPASPSLERDREQQTLLQRLRTQNETLPTAKVSASRTRVARPNDEVVFVGKKEVTTRKLLLLLVSREQREKPPQEKKVENA